VAALAGIFIGPLILLALLANEPTGIFWSAIVLDLVVLFAFVAYTYERPALFVGVLVLWFAAQRLVVALIAPHVDGDMVRALLTYKEGYYFILPAAAATALYLRWRRGEQTITPLLLADVVALTWLGILAVHFAAAGDPSTPELTYARRFAAPLLLYAGGRLLVPALGELASSLRFVLGVAVVVAALGVIERFVLEIGFWINSVDAAAFYEKQVEGGLLPENWTVIYRGVPDGIFISLPLETPVRRLVSTFLEPTTLGSFLAFALLVLLFAPRLVLEPKSRLYQRLAGAGLCLLTIAVLATLSRGAMVTVLAGGALFVAVRASQGIGALRGLPWLSGGLVAAVMTVGVAITSLSQFPGDSQVRDILETRAVSGLSAEPTVATPDLPASDTVAPVEGPLEEITVHPPGSTAEGASKHLDGLRSGLDKMLEEPLGAGLGAAGNWSDAPEAGGESAVGVVAAQTGAPGLLAYVAFYAAAIGAMIAVSWRRSDAQTDLSLVLAGALFGLFIVSFVSESAFGLLGNAPYFIFAGWMLAVAVPAAQRVRLSVFPRTERVESAARRDRADSTLDGSAVDSDTVSR
jgi:hypothetical protein